MNKLLIGGIVVLVVIIGIVGTYLLTAKSSDNNSGSTSLVTSKGSDSPLIPVTACDVLTDDVVHEVIGKDVKKVTQPASATATASGSNDNNITLCSYMNSPAASSDASVTPKIDGATLLVYSAKTTAGAKTNRTQFTTTSQDTQKVDGLGDVAFYNKTFRQLNILKGNNWYVVTNFKDTILNSTLQDDIALAKKLQLK